VQRGKLASVFALCVAVSFGVAAFFVDHVRELLYVASAAGLIVVAGWTRHRHRMTRRLLLTIVGIAVTYIGAWVSEAQGAPQIVSEGLDFAGAVLVAFALAQLFHRREDRSESQAHRSALTEGIVGDGLILALGSWLVSWVVIVEPMLQRRSDTGVSVVAGLYIPLGCGLLFLVAVAMFRSPVRHAGLTLLCVAVVFAIAGDVANGLFLAGHFGPVAEHLSYSFYIAAYGFAAAAFLHPSTATLQDVWHQGHRKTVIGRVAATTGAMVAAIVVMAAVPSPDVSDRVVRIVASVALGLAVTWRVISAVQSNQRTQALLVRGAQTDPLTGLPNRSLICDEINDMLHNSWHTQSVPTVYFVDLDRFKNINDSLGHSAGDELLTQVAMRLRSAAPPSALVGRLSGDEYVVVDADTESPGRAISVADRLLGSFREPFGLSDGDVFITASVGVASAGSSSITSADDLLRRADTAMYRAKDAGRNCMAIYDESMHERVAQRLALETSLYRALDRRELKLFHQPIIDLETADVVGFEALMRWQHGDGTVISPAEFIPIAEETGTIVSIGAWALLEALTQLRTWIDDGVCASSATMSVNVSPRQLADGNFPGIVQEALTRSGMSPHQLWVEVTESTMISDPEVALATLRRLRAIGVRIALDDFGTGYSSLSLLQRFPLQRLKIDRAFIHGVADNTNDRSLVKTIIAMGRALGLDLVAEGVESIRQLQTLHELGCLKAQGYLISHPVPSDAMRSTVTALERLSTFPGLPGEANDSFTR
jgi:diguanylate cyclase